ncbi:MAG: 30S ribosome-binding factor RbfA [Verrucomicrobiales bacterium]|nr:30S ribosome-binding factor RbfA [Verrucomicrobiales bacterium]
MSQRLDRINELLRREISACIEKHFEFPDTLVTVHDVETAVDLKNANVFIGVIGSADQGRAVLNKLNGKRGFIQGTVMKRVVLRNTPHLHFKIDDSVERGVRILNLLDEIGDVDLPDDPDARTDKL